MASEEADLEPYLAVGCPVVFHSDPFVKEAPRYPSIVRGWRKPSYLLLDRPRAMGRYAAIRENQPCVIRFVCEGKACAFDSMVLDWDTRQYNAYCRVEWPRSVKVVAFRKYERAKVQIPCRFKVGFGSFMGEIQDLSVGGCRFQTSNSVDVGVEATIHFTLPDGMAIDQVYCVVRNVQSASNQTFVGCEFMPGQVCVESHIAFFITNMLERSGMQNAREHEVLIIDDDPARASELRRIFQLKGYSALVATGMLDGLARLRSKPPEAALIRARQKDLPGMTAARLLRVSPGFESIPVFLHDAGENDSVLPNDNNIRGLFPVGSPALEVVNRVIGALGSNINSCDFLMSSRSTPNMSV